MKATARFKQFSLPGYYKDVMSLQLTWTGKKIPDREILISNRD